MEWKEVDSRSVSEPESCGSGGAWDESGRRESREVLDEPDADEDVCEVCEGAGERVSARGYADSLSSAMRLRCVRFLTRCKASTFSFDAVAAVARGYRKSNLAVSSSLLWESLSLLSSSSSTSALSAIRSDVVLLILLVLRCSVREFPFLNIVLNVTSRIPTFPLPPLLLLLNDSGLSRIAMLCGSPVLPLPVEFVAGGEGKPEPLELAPGLGGSGRSGMLSEAPSGGVLMLLGGVCGCPLPMYTADRRLAVCLGLASGFALGGIEAMDVEKTFTRQGHS